MCSGHSLHSGFVGFLGGFFLLKKQTNTLKLAAVIVQMMQWKLDLVLPSSKNMNLLSFKHSWNLSNNHVDMPDKGSAFCCIKQRRRDYKTKF